MTCLASFVLIQGELNEIRTAVDLNRIIKRLSATKFLYVICSFCFALAVVHHAFVRTEY